MIFGAVCRWAPKTTVGGSSTPPASKSQISTVREVVGLIASSASGIVAFCTLFGIKLPIPFLAPVTAELSKQPRLFLGFSLLLLSCLLLNASFRRFQDRRAEDWLRAVGEEGDNWARGCYSELIRRHVRLLAMSKNELAVRAGIRRRDAGFIINHPDYFPRADVVKAVRRALMVPVEWPAGGYGDKCTKERLLWYSKKGYAALTAEKIEGLTSEVRRTVLDAIEQQRRADLNPKRGRYE